ncbi:MAG: transglutaminaseTgpA domain-containing protein [Acidimicrobiales bacterium]
MDAPIERPRRPWRQQLLVAGAAIATVGVVTQQTTRIFADDYRVVVVVAAAALAGALVAVTTRLPWPVRALVGLVAVLGAGAAGVAAHDGTLPDGLLDAVTSGINDVVAAVWPSPALAASVGAIALAAAIAAVAAVVLAQRGLAAAALLPSLALIGLVALLSAPAGAPPMWSMSAYAVAALLVFRWQHPGGRSNVGRVWAGIVVVLAAVVPLALGGIASSERYDPRDEIERPSSAQAALSPLARVDEWRSRTPEEVMFRTDLATPTRWRLVGLPRYDGLAWLPADDYRRAGSAVGEPITATPPTGAHVVVESLDTLWLPAVGNPLEVSADVQVDGGRSGLLPDAEPVRGTEYDLDFEDITALPAQLAAVPAGPSSAAGVFVGVDELPSGITELAAAITAGTTDDYQRAQAIATYLREKYSLDRESPVGHSLAILDLFLERTRRGRDEQFVASFGVLAAAVGLPVRIAVGFDTIPTTDGGTEALSSAAVAWPEVEFEGFGWVAFDPVPEEEADAPPAEGEGAVAPVDDNATPPPATTAPPTPDSTVPQDETPTQNDVVVDEGLSTGTVRAIAGGAALIALLLGYVLSVLVLKRRRRVRRRRQAAATRRARGAFSTGVDALIDAGARARTSATDRELVAAGSRSVGDAAVLLQPVADAATAAVFDPDAPSTLDADAAWGALEQFEDHMQAELGRVRWWRTRLSVRSLRRGIRD